MGHCVRFVGKKVTSARNNVQEHAMQAKSMRKKGKESDGVGGLTANRQAAPRGGLSECRRAERQAFSASASAFSRIFSAAS